MHAAVRSRYLAGLRRGWRAWLALAVLSGLGAGIALAAVTDARRTWSALPRALAAANASDANVSGDATQLGPDKAAAYADAVRDLPGVRAATRVAGVDLERVRADGSFDPALRSGHALGFIITAEKGEQLNQARMIQGRLPRDYRPDEIAINDLVAHATGWRVGETVSDLKLFRVADHDENDEPDPAKGSPLQLRIVGVAQPIDDLVGGDRAIPRVFLSPAFAERYPEPFYYLIESVALRGGEAGVSVFRAQVQATAAEHGAQPSVAATADGLRVARDGLRPQIVAIWLFGVVVLVVMALLAGQAIGRQVQAHEPDLPELRALGMTRGQRRLLGVLHGLTVAGVAALVAVVAAVGLSAFTPIGSARAYEWDRGLLVDGRALAVGGLVVVVLLTAASVIPAARVAHRAEVVPGLGAVGALAEMPGVAAASGLALGSVRIDGTEVPAWGVDAVKGTVFPTLDRGRLPLAPTEVVLGRKTSRQLHADVGDVVQVASVDRAARPQPMTVVGLATFPLLGLERYRETSLGVGAATVASVMGPGDGAGKYNFGLVRFEPGLDRQTSVADLRARVAELGCNDQGCVLTDLRPTVLGSYARLGGVWGPALVALVALLVMTLTHGLVTSVRARREDLAILCALGFSRREIRRVVVWESLTLSSCALLVGVPLGIATSSLAWLLFTRWLGITPGGANPGVALIAVVVGVVVAAALIGVLCSTEATRRRGRLTGPFLQRAPVGWAS